MGRFVAGVGPGVGEAVETWDIDKVPGYRGFGDEGDLALECGEGLGDGEIPVGSLLAADVAGER